MKGMRRILLVAALSIVAGLAALAPAGAQELEIEVFAPEQGITGQPVEIAAFVREAGTGRPVEGATVVFFGDASFVGVGGVIELGRAITNEAGFGILRPSFSVSRVHEVRVEMLDAPEVEPVSVSIAVSVGAQIIEPEAGVSIPGVGSWVVTLIIGFVWSIMIVAAVLGMVAVSRAGRQAEATAADSGTDRRARRLIPQLSVAHLAAGIMVVLGIGLVTLLLRSPESHSNLNPEGYDRTAVAYLEAAYVYPGPGHAAAALTGDSVTDGRVLFMSYGCAGCHGVDGQGTAAARTPAFATRQWTESVVRAGVPGGMPAYPAGDLTEDQLDLIHFFLLDARDRITALGLTTTTSPVVTTSAPPDPGEGPSAIGYEEDIAALLTAECGACHGSAGGWSAGTYREVIESGDNGPAVIPGDVANSILAQKISGTQTFGAVMPPGQPLPPEEVALILAWIETGAPERAAAPATGAALYAERCAVCHGAAGEGAAGPALTGPPLPPSEIAAVVADGRGAMGGFAASLTPDEINQIAAFTLTLGEEVPVDEPSVAAGAEVFRLQCARCHADDASGDVGPALSLSTLTSEQTRTVIASGRAEMPAFGDALGPDEIESLLLFVEDRKAAAVSGTTTAPSATGVPHPGSELYVAACATCHGADAGGGLATGLAGTALSANDLIARVYGGHEGGMPAFEGVLTPAEVQDVARYILELEGAESAAGVPDVAWFAAIAALVLIVAFVVWRPGRRSKSGA